MKGSQAVSHAETVDFHLIFYLLQKFQMM